MPLKTLVRTPTSIIANHYQNKRLLLIHPSSRYHNLIVAALLHDPPCPVFYHSVNHDDVTLHLFLSSLLNGLRYQRPGFGVSLQNAMPTCKQEDNYEVCAETLARDLAAMQDDDFIFIIDEFDRLEQSADILTFIENLVPLLPVHCHLLINGRTMPRIPWMAYVAEGWALVVGERHISQTSDYVLGAPNVEVRAFGAGNVVVDGELVEWEGILPKMLLFYTLDRNAFTRDDICESFWPDLPVDQAVNVFHVTKRRLHRILGFDCVVHDRDHYHLNTELNIRYDVLDFADAINQTRTMPDGEQVRVLREAISLYRGDYLQNHDEEWVVERRERFKQSYTQALKQLAEVYERIHQLNQALGLYLQIAAESPAQHKAHLDVLRLYSRLSKFDAARHYYNRVKAQHRGARMPAELEALYDNIQHQAAG